MLNAPQEVLAYAREAGIQIVDVKFVDLLGLWRHFSLPLSALGERDFEEGLGYDGSSIIGFQGIHESDLILIPDPTTAVQDPLLAVPTLSLICNVYDPITRLPYSRDPRRVAQAAERYLIETGIATTSYWGPEAEFFVFGDVRFDNTPQAAYFFLDGEEAEWNYGRNGGQPNLGHRARHKEHYFQSPPVDTMQDLRSEIALRLIEAGVQVEVHHTEVGSGQQEIDLRFNSLTKMADWQMMYKYVIKNVARRHGYTATFMPKPIFGDNGSGMHVHNSLWRDDEALFFDAGGYAMLSELALHYIGGVLKHSAALLAFCAPTTNSYRRLTPGFEAPVNLVYSQRNRSAGIRIPRYSDSPRAKRIEYRCPDPTANPYLAFSAILMAGLDGIQNRIDPGDPADFDLYELEPEEAAKIKTVPSSLSESLAALEADHEFLLKGGVFTPDLIETWIKTKRANEIDPLRLRPHPYEFYLYYDA
ncbi:MAG: type I glutamate--ammonia ligase [Chloroflexi bacterium]|nr:type I glutamate--ammonia ligase [Chloroflexota bacterium]MCI0580966.1 type I glutamate--ammonia ligase [Chloroflexota bacterium]MCI0645362.1 type I glutamate--ammonia ligase [Chloroflexota bacterium]MCI0729304.1 type I glutamate--ammonia ligase [Chloroflexota bacterium]